MSKGAIGVIVAFGVIGAVLVAIALSVQSVVAKWVLGILGALVILLTIYMIIESIVKIRRRPKDFSDYMKQALKESINSPDFGKRMEAAANKRDLLYKGQRPGDEDYGFSSSNPVMASTISSSKEYLGNLRTDDGLAFTWERVGSVNMRRVHDVPDVIVDKYKLFLNGEEYETIYICPYGHDSSYAPFGMKLVKQ